MTLRRLAPAKVNLYLHVAAPDARGYHPLRSMVAFADIGDELQLIRGGKGRFYIDGPYAEGLSTGEDNLVMKAVRLFEKETGRENKALDYKLTKNLPLASGIGGGSADAGAVLRLLADGKHEISDETLDAIAAGTGADGVMCLWSKACIAEGYGEKLSPVILPSLPCVLINPGVECPTPDVFRAYDEVASYKPLYTRWFTEGLMSPDMLGRKMISYSIDPKLQPEQLFDYLADTRNDLEPAAIRLRPVIGDVLAALRAKPEARFARMSGSGATCFALCDTRADADTLADDLRKSWPKAWIRACTLN